VSYKTEATEFLQQSRTLPVIDVRSESEFLQGHIPGAMNMPLFDNEERAIVGTLYKKSGREASVLKGLEFAGPKLADFIKQLHKISDQKKVLVHCWRGGMRSESMAWLFETAGYHPLVLAGGYKAYRRFIREELSKSSNNVILGGLTGSGKTDILELLREKGEQVLDLEKLANHKGSVFGGFGQAKQPTNEQFENDIYAEWEKMDLSVTTWIEDESRMIGNVSIPDPLFEQMNNAPMIRIEIDGKERIKKLVEEYSRVDRQDLRLTVNKISEKLGGTNTKKALEAIENNNFELIAELALSYYDKSYSHSVMKRKNQRIFSININSSDHKKNVQLILDSAKRFMTNVI
jgi:tRNA 2-selenouridine synthase